ncbi:MAG TPA: hypothetical protein VK986_26945 [Tepidisphaeraceae bacterium]|nr:hypothetical protein [Tepidisphaeraceae bacterium]
MNHRLRAALICALLATPTIAQEVKVLQSYETDADAKAWEFKQKSATPSDRHVTHGKRSLKLAGNEYMVTFRPPKDWSGYDALELDVFVDGDGPVGGSLLIGDADFLDKAKGKGSYWNRHNGSFVLRPGANTVSIPVNGLYRGEAGSRGHDLKTNIDPKQIVRVDIGFAPKAGSNVTALFVDNLRLSKDSAPDGILAFDLGPASQTVFPGFTAIAPQTVYGKDGARAGLNAATVESAARDDTFPTRLYRDAISLEGATFTADVAERNATYHAWVVYSDLGYWGGEQAQYRKRSIVSVPDGKVVFSEDRGAAGPADFLYRFENVEPKPGDKLWDLYVSELFKPRRFTVQSSHDGKVSLRFGADGGLSSRVAAFVLYPASIKDKGDTWVAQIEQRNKAEFEARAVFLPGTDLPARVPDRRADGYELGFPSMDDDVRFADGPGAPNLRTDRPAALGQRVSFTFAVRPTKAEMTGPVTATVDGDLWSGNGGAIPAAAVDVRYAHNGTRRGFNEIAYTIAPDTLRPVSGSRLELRAGETRQFWVTVTVPRDARPGQYGGSVHLRAGRMSEHVNFGVDVQPFPLDEPDFMMGVFGVHVPRPIAQARGDDAMRDLLRVMREYGMNSFSGGPSVKFSGYDAAGKPVLDFAAVDKFMALAREAGFTKPLIAYGGPGGIEGLHGSYVVGEVGRNWEQKLGKPFGQILGEVWAAHRDHAKAANWLPVLYEMTDEPRVLKQAQDQVELMKLYREHAPWVDIGGSYSVEWHKKTPFDLAVVDIFKTLNWSSLNLHTQDDLDMGKQLGKGIHIYNQGRTRYSFGAYQFAEWRKGVQSRMQWHLLALHGYQFFDLDGREPDTAMIHWGKAGILPTIHLARCREGADDFRYAVTLFNLATKKQDTPAGKEALEWLEGINKQIGINQNKRPAGFMDDETFRNECAARLRKLM